MTPAERPVSLIRLVHLTDKSKSSELFAYARFGNQVSQVNQVKRPQSEERKTTMNDTRTIKVKADAALAQAIAGKHIKRWSSTTHSNGRKYVNVTFEEVSVLGKID